jgi:hypothetical protein
MKKLLLVLLAVATFTSCEKETIEPIPEPNYTVEGKWLWSPTENRVDANTMYEFVDGIRYTYYCNTSNCDDDYWNSLETTDALPAINPYTFENDTLIVDLNFGSELVSLVTFECDGGKIEFGNFKLWRLSSNCQ